MAEAAAAGWFVRPVPPPPPQPAPCRRADSVVTRSPACSHDVQQHISMGAGRSKDVDKNGKSIYEKESLVEHEGAINCMALSEDGSLLVTGSDDTTARMWSTQTDDTECLGELRGHESYITCVASSDIYILTGSADKTIRKWDMTNCECLYIYQGHTERINRLISTGEFIFSSSHDRTVRAWMFDTEDLKDVPDANPCVRTFQGHKAPIMPIIFLPGSTDSDDDGDGTVAIDAADLLITGSLDNTAKSWSLDTGACLRTFRGHIGPIACMATDPEGETLFTAGTDKTIKVWEIITGILNRTMEGHSDSVLCMQVMNKLMYTGSKDKTARCWVIAFGECTRTYKKSAHTVSCLKVADGVVFTGSGDTNARAYDAKSGALKRTFVGHESAISCLQYINYKLYTGSNDGILKVWDARDIADDPVIEEKEFEDEDVNEEIKHYQSETKRRLKDLESRLDGLGTQHDEDIEQMEEELAGIKELD